jgi:hypothetical protein
MTRSSARLEPGAYAGTSGQHGEDEQQPVSQHGPVGGQVEREDHIAEYGEGQHAGDRADETALPPEQAGPADDYRRD